MRKSKVHRELISREELSVLSHPYQVRFAIFCARQVIHLVKEKDRAICEEAILTAERWLVGEATKEECRIAAAYAAYAANAYANAAANAANAANAAANAANAYANAAAYAANAANTAANAKDKQILIDAQWEVYEDLLNIDKHLEDAIGLESA